MTVKEKSQTLAQQLLAKRYLASLKEGPEQYIGVELEFPIVNTLGKQTDVLVTKALFKYLQEVEEFIAIKLDEDGNPVQLQHEINKDQIINDIVNGKIANNKNNLEVYSQTIHISYDEYNKLKPYEIQYDTLKNGNIKIIN